MYHIGLPLLRPDLHDVYVHLSPVSSLDVRLLHLNQLHRALTSDPDPDLSLVPPSLHDRVLYRHFFFAVGVIIFHSLLGLVKSQ